MALDRFPPGWDESRVRAVIEHYEQQTDEEAVREDEAYSAGRLLQTLGRLTPRVMMPWALNDFFGGRRP